ncbi:MAG: nuclear transport factor 2 family protein [Myxococcota bacterium]
MEAVIDTYCAAWNADDRASRTDLLERACRPEVVYVDPRTEVTGIAALVDWIEGVRQGRPGARVVRTTALDTHHDLVRFGWHLVLADGQTHLSGSVDVCVLEDGRLAKIMGFFGPAPRL